MDSITRVINRRFGNGFVLSTSFALIFIIAIMLVACAPATSVQSTENPTAQSVTDITPAPTQEDQPVAEVTPAATQSSPEETLAPPAGLVYRNEDGLWLVDSDGNSRLMSNHADAVPSPDLSLAYLWDYEASSLTLIDLSTGQEKVVLTDPNLNGLFTWAGNQTILLGLYLSPEEADGPNYGHLASLDVAGETITVLDSEHLMSSIPVLSPDGQTIAYSSDGPYLYRPDEGVYPFPAETFTGLSGISGLMSPSWSPNGRYLAWIVYGGPFGDDPDQTMGLAIYDLETSTATLRLFFDPARWGATPPAAVWSPSSQWLALRVFANGEEDSGLWLLDIEGLQQQYIPGVSGNANYPVWSPDGRQLFYVDYADEDEPPYAARLIFDMDENISYPVDMANGLGLLWLEPGIMEGPVVEEPGGEDPLCLQVPRPAILLIDRENYFITNWSSQQSCPFDFPGELPGLIQSGGEDIYYHELDFTTQIAVIRRLSPDGSNTTLPFTETELPAQFLHYIVSEDGRYIAWSVTRLDESGQPVSDLWLAGTDGSDQTQLLTAIPGTDNRSVIPIRFSPDNQQLYYAMQPIGIGGSWVAFNGRYASLYATPVTGGQPVELFQCPSGICLGDFTEDGGAVKVAYTDTAGKTIYLQTADGATAGQFSFPEADFVGYPTFGPGGELAFYVATVSEHANGTPIAQPGAIYLVLPPYDGQPQLVKSDDTVGTLIGWLDSDHLVYNSIDPGGNWGTGVTSLAGEAMIWGAGPTQFITILR